MKKRREKSFHIRLNLEKATDRDIWEWLKTKEENQTISINAFVIEGLRKLKLAEMRADAGTVETPVTDTMYSLNRQAPPGDEGLKEQSMEAENRKDSEEPDAGTDGTELSEEAMNFIDAF